MDRAEKAPTSQKSSERHAGDTEVPTLNLDIDIAEERDCALHPEQHGGKGVVNIKHLRKVYPKGKAAEPKIAVADLCLSIRPGNCFGLLGPNGAGKPQLCRCSRVRLGAPLGLPQSLT